MHSGYMSLPGDGCLENLLAERTSSKMHLSSTRSSQLLVRSKRAWALPRGRTFHHWGISHQLNRQMDENKAMIEWPLKHSLRTLETQVCHCCIEVIINDIFDSCYSCSKSVWNHLSNETTANVLQFWTVKIMLILFLLKANFVSLPFANNKANLEKTIQLSFYK